MSLFDDDEVDNLAITVNENYAERFAERKQREELQRRMFPFAFNNGIFPCYFLHAMESCKLLIDDISTSITCTCSER